MADQRKYYAEIFLVSFAALLLEISYTRLISFKLFYYYTYLIIGLALLGIGSGGVFVAVSSRLKRVDLATLLARCSLAGAISTGLGYFVIAEIVIDTRAIWTKAHVVSNVALLMVVCLALFSTFLAVGIMIASLFGRAPERIKSLYFADLVGAGLACVVVVPLLGWIGPPGAIFLAGSVLALTSVKIVYRDGGRMYYWSAIVAAVMAVCAAFPASLPDPQTDPMKTVKRSTELAYSSWSPVFRVDVTTPWRTKTGEQMVLHHDGLWGTAIHRFDGDVTKLTRFDSSARALPFKTLAQAPEEVLIIGSAGGNEILASLYYGAGNVTGVELNPVTVSLLTDVFPDYTGRVHEHPDVSIVNGDGRSYIARDDRRYDLIYFVAPDSYTAMNAATSGAFVLTESYLYTVEMIMDTLERLTDDGIICMQFGEFSYDDKPNRTARYVATAREALHRMGIDSHDRHMLVATTPDFMSFSYSSILLKRTEFTDAEIERFLEETSSVEGAVARHAWNRELDDGPVNKIIELGDEPLASWLSSHRYDVRAITDDSPFFWHFVRFSTVLAEFTRPLDQIDLEDSLGERILLLLLALSAVFAAVFLLVPFVAIRQTWSQLPSRAASAIYFSALGLGFMFFEVCLIQKLTLFLGYPTYSLTVTLMSLLIFTGIGSLSTGLYEERRDAALPVLLAMIVLLTGFYQFGLDPLVRALMPLPLWARILFAFGCLAPLGLCLGAFMPLGLLTVSRLSVHRDEYVAWAWAVNGFFSVIGSVLTTILSMTLGFRVVLMLGVAAYLLAVVTLRRIPLARAHD